MAMSPAEAFGQAVRETRLKLDLSQEAAALHGDIDRGFLGHVERGTKTPTLNTVWRVAEALEVKPARLVARAERILARGN